MAAVKLEFNSVDYPLQLNMLHNLMYHHIAHVETLKMRTL